MNRFAKILLIVLTAISVYVILYVGLGIGYPIGVSDNYEQINEVLENLSYSYLAGCIFYILTVTIPAKVRRHRLDSVLHSKIGVIVGKIRDSKQCVRTLVELQNNTFLSDSDMLSRMEANTFSTPSSMAFFYGSSSTIASYLNAQKREILDMVYDIQRYSYLLSDKELKSLADFTNCSYFDLLKIAGNQITDTPQIRRSIGEALLEAEKIIKEIY